MYPYVMADRKSTRLNSSHRCISYAVFCLKKKRTWVHPSDTARHTRRHSLPQAGGCLVDSLSCSFSCLHFKSGEASRFFFQRVACPEVRPFSRKRDIST